MVVRGAVVYGAALAEDSVLLCSVLLWSALRIPRASLGLGLALGFGAHSG